MTVQAQLLPGAFGKRSGDQSVRSVIEASGWTIMESANKPDAKRLSLLTRDNPMSVPGATATEATSFPLTTYTARTVGIVWTNRGKYSVEY